jgi:hypothetical protein
MSATAPQKKNHNNNNNSEWRKDEKREMLSEFHKVEQETGVRMNRHWTMEDPLDEMRFAYFALKKDQRSRLWK